MDKYFKKNAEPTKEEKKAILRYSISDHKQINEFLSKNIAPENISEEEIKVQIKQIDGYLQKFELINTAIVYRIEVETYYGIDNINDILELYSANNEILYNFFISTSFSEEVADNWVLKYKNQNANYIIKMSILINPGLQCAYIKEESAFPEEDEVLIARNAKLTIFNSRIEDNNIIRVFAKMT